MSATLAPNAPLFVILSSSSGGNDAGDTQSIIEGVLTQARRPCELIMVEHAGQLADVARSTLAKAQARAGAVVVAGGDGAINAVVQVLRSSSCPLGIIPQGTFNYFARTHGIPTDVEQAVRVLLRGRIEPVQIGLINEHAFLVNASLGLYPELLEDREAYKQKFGRTRLTALFAGIFSVLRHHRQLHIRLELDGESRDLRTPTLFVGNNRLQLEQIGMPLAKALDAGQLVGLTVKPIGTSALIWLMLLGAFGHLGDAEQVQSFSFREMAVRVPDYFWRGRFSGAYFRPRIKVATDGEIVWLDAPLEIRVAPQPLYLLKADDGHAGSADLANLAAGSGFNRNPDA